MQALLFPAVNEISVHTVPDPVPAAGEVVVNLRAAALNHRDLWIKLGQYAGLKWPCIPGSDGAGIVSAIGAGVEDSWLGCEVIINPSFNWGVDLRAQGTAFNILGLPRQGTLAEKVAVPAAQLAPKPAHLTWEEAAALPLAGLTAWRALMSRGELFPGERILITGAGGGVASVAVQFAVAHDAEVWVTSSASGKIEKAVALGAKGGALYTELDWANRLAGRSGLFDVIMDSAGGEGFGRLVDLVAPGGRIVFFGATRGNASGLDLRKLFWRQISLLGTTMGTPAEFAAMMDFVALHALKPAVSDVFPLHRGAEAFALMERGGQFGKIVVRIGGG